MTTKERMENMLGIVSKMSESEQSELIDQIMNLMKKPKNSKTAGSCHDLIENTEIPDCPHCGANASMGEVTTSGRKGNGARRYKCKKCGKTFVATTGTAFARTKKSADTWRRYIELTLSGHTLEDCKHECGISYQCSFRWRHKLLHVFEENLESVQMSETVEVDEMLIPLSFKGNHVQGKFGTRTKASGAENHMPREAYNRGTDNISRSSKDKACVFCMVENGDKAFYAAVPGVGFMNKQMLDATVGKHTNKETVQFLADNYKITRQYFEDNGYSHTILSSNTSDNPHDHKPEIKDGKHMQHVNAMHHQLRQFLAPYCGVSSKYLSHYVAMFIWLKSFRNNKKQTKRNQVAHKKSVEKASIARAAMPGSYISGARLDSRPAVPRCA